jgi:hypothetical protein
MANAVGDRRHEPRARMPEQIDDVRATLRPGRHVALVDVSRNGALLQSAQPMRPGSRVHLQVVSGAKTVTLLAHVLRCAVWSLHAPDGIAYRGAVRFEHRCDVLGELVTRFGYV